MLAGLGLAFLAPMFEDRVVSIDAAERHFALRILAMVPAVRSKERRLRRRRLSILEYFAIKPLSRYAESFRALKVGLHILDHQAGKIVQVTSAVPGEGKSTIAASLALSAAAGGVRTALVDLDFYKPAVSRMFGLEQPQGVVDVLLGDMPASAFLQAHQQLPLRILGAGSSRQPRPEVIETRHFKLFVEELRKSFDLVILDTSPVLATSAATLISGVADATLLVVAWRSTQQGRVDQAVGALRAAGAPVAGIVLNKVEPSRFGGYKGYGYD
jgi:capsular exopolysaccharide synthesis family protein